MLEKKPQLISDRSYHVKLLKTKQKNKQTNKNKKPHTYNKLYIYSTD